MPFGNIPWYRGGPELFAEAERERRQWAAGGQIAGSVVGAGRHIYDAAEANRKNAEAQKASLIEKLQALSGVSGAGGRVPFAERANSIRALHHLGATGDTTSAENVALDDASRNVSPAQFPGEQRGPTPNSLARTGEAAVNLSAALKMGAGVGAPKADDYDQQAEHGNQPAPAQLGTPTTGEAPELGGMDDQIQQIIGEGPRRGDESLFMHAARGIGSRIPGLGVRGYEEGPSLALRNASAQGQLTARDRQLGAIKAMSGVAGKVQGAGQIAGAVPALRGIPSEAFGGIPKQAPRVGKWDLILREARETGRPLSEIAQKYMRPLTPHRPRLHEGMVPVKRTVYMLPSGEVVSASDALARPDAARTTITEWKTPAQVQEMLQTQEISEGDIGSADESPGLSVKPADPILNLTTGLPLWEPAHPESDQTPPVTGDIDSPNGRDLPEKPRIGDRRLFYRE